eukprot:GHRR01029992.1.p1 GENE.GHRR01029992.1~~GHRR01029992.1.p1  ORF type:complete len:174 (+),score=31.09 GHRR01029992.1:181-702(+)
MLFTCSDHPPEYVALQSSCLSTIAGSVATTYQISHRPTTQCLACVVASSYSEPKSQGLATHLCTQGMSSFSLISPPNFASSTARVSPTAFFFKNFFRPVWKKPRWRITMLRWDSPDRQCNALGLQVKLGSQVWATTHFSDENFVTWLQRQCAAACQQVEHGMVTQVAAHCRHA